MQVAVTSVSYSPHQRHRDNGQRRQLAVHPGPPTPAPLPHAQLLLRPGPPRVHHRRAVAPRSPGLGAPGPTPGGPPRGCRERSGGGRVPASPWAPPRLCTLEAGLRTARRSPPLLPSSPSPALRPPARPEGSGLIPEGGQRGLGLQQEGGGLNSVSCFPRKTNKPSGCMRPRSILNNGLGLSEMSREPKGKSAGLLLRARERPLQKTLWGRWCVDVRAHGNGGRHWQRCWPSPEKAGATTACFLF